MEDECERFVCPICSNTSPNSGVHTNKSQLFKCINNVYLRDTELFQPHFGKDFKSPTSTMLEPRLKWIEPLSEK